jgi:hypothetical protein
VKKPPVSNAAVFDSANRAGGLTLPPPGGGVAPQPAPVPAVQPAVQAQSAIQAAPNAGLIDAPEDEHSLNLAASGLPAPALPMWMRLGLGATAVSLLAGAALVLTRPDPVRLMEASQK